MPIADAEEKRLDLSAPMLEAGLVPFNQPRGVSRDGGH
jgi:hypothetical protein